MSDPSFEKLSEKLIEGWDLCNYTCKDCNKSSMVKNQDDKVFCGVCMKYYNYEGLDEDGNAKMSDMAQEDVAKFVSEKKMMTPFTLRTPQTHAGAAPVAAQGNSKQADVSDVIGQKMLQGWTLMAESCPDCQAPYLKSKDGKLLCPGCNKYASTNSGAGGSRQSPFIQRGSGRGAESDQKAIQLKTVSWWGEVNSSVEEILKSTREETVRALCEKSQAAIEKLNMSEDLDESLRLISFINKCSKGVTEVKTKWGIKSDF